MSSVRQQIVDALEVRIADIVSGDTVTVDGSVHTYSFTPAQTDTWRTTAYGEEELPAVNLQDGDVETDGAAEIGRREHALEVNIGVYDKGSTSVDEIRDMLLDLVKTVGADQTLGGLSHRILIAGHSVEAGQGSAKLAEGVLTITVLYRTGPFTL